MSKKIPIHLSEKDLKDIEKISLLLGLNGVYGEIPKCFKYSITFTLNSINTIEKSIPDLKPDDLEILFSSIKRIKSLRAIAQKGQDLIKMAKKV